MGLAMQYVGTETVQTGLDYIVKTWGAPKNYIYGVAGAPYFGTYGAPSQTFSTIADIYSVLVNGPYGLTLLDADFGPGSIVNVISEVNGSFANTTYQGWGDYYGLKFVAYEGGIDISLAGPTSLVSEAVLGTGIQPLIQQEYSDWFGCGNDLFNYYSLADNGSFFGLYEDITVPNVKTEIVQQISQQKLGQFTKCPTWLQQAP